MKNCEEKLEDFLFNNKIYHNNIIAEAYGFRAGFKAALEWAKTQTVETVDHYEQISLYRIQEELNDTSQDSSQ